MSGTDKWIEFAKQYGREAWDAMLRAHVIDAIVGLVFWSMTLLFCVIVGKHLARWAHKQAEKNKYSDFPYEVTVVLIGGFVLVLAVSAAVSIAVNTIILIEPAGTLARSLLE